MTELLEAAAAAERMVEKDYLHLIPVSGRDRFGMARSGLELLPRLIELPERFMAFRQIVGEANRQFPDHKISEPGDGFVMAAGLSALFIALTATDLEDGIKEAVHLGKDTDTLAAMVGAVLGARFGEQGIPERWRKGLVNADQVALRGEALLEKSVEGLKLRDLVSMEAELTRQEEKGRAEFIGKLEAKGEFRPPAPKKPKPRPAPLPEGPPPEPDQALKLSRRGKRKKPERVKAPWKK